MKNNLEKATFSAGCFWGVEETFSKVNGVISTQVGYTGGHTKNPTYKEVCADTTGHAEAIEIIFDPNVVSYEELLEVFWQTHDPTTLNRQGPDIGTQYRSAIFYHNEQQKNFAEILKQNIEKSGKFKSKVVTEITEAKEFYRAEDYHQKYFEKMGISH